MKLGHTALTRSILTCSALLALAPCGHAVETKAKAPAKGAPHPKGPSQSSVASKSVTFASIGKADALYKGALDAHDLGKAKAQIGKMGAFRGTVSKAFDSANIVILDFDPQYKTALAAVVKKGDFAKFPNLKALTGKTVVVFGKFADFHGGTQIVLASPSQVKLVK